MTIHLAGLVGPDGQDDDVLGKLASLGKKRDAERGIEECRLEVVLRQAQHPASLIDGLLVEVLECLQDLIRAAPASAADVSADGNGALDVVAQQGASSEDRRKIAATLEEHAPARLGKLVRLADHDESFTRVLHPAGTALLRDFGAD